jgi:hypothetical protein
MIYTKPTLKLNSQVSGGCNTGLAYDFGHCSVGCTAE